jgi:hypothetical protein
MNTTKNISGISAECEDLRAKIAAIRDQEPALGPMPERDCLAYSFLGDAVPYYSDKAIKYERQRCYLLGREAQLAVSVPLNATEAMQKKMSHAIRQGASMNDVWRAAVSEL